MTPFRFAAGSSRRRLWWQESLSLWRRGLLGASAVMVLVASALAVVGGHARVKAERQGRARAEAEAREQLTHLHRAESSKDDLGLLLYYLTVPISQDDTPLGALATGVRGEVPVIRTLRLTGLVPQLEQLEVTNPAAQYAGHFDLAFVLVFLAPLVGIALSYDVLSRDSELGTLAMVLSTVSGTRAVAGRRLVLRGAWLAGLTLLGVLGALGALGVGWSPRIVWLVGALLGYQAFWFLVVAAVVAQRRSSAFNAMALIGAWLGVCVVLPNLSQAVASIAFPVGGGAELTLDQRMDMNARWDRPKADTMRPFVAAHPEWKSLRVPDSQFSWPWYYAMHEMADAHVASHLSAYEQQLEGRAQWIETVAMLLPSVALQLVVERLAGNDWATALAFRRSVRDYHREVTRAMYLWLTDARPVADFSLEQLPQHRFSPASVGLPRRALSVLLGYLLIAVGLVLWWTHRSGQSTHLAPSYSGKPLTRVAGARDVSRRGAQL